jgi:hypothetical protein
MLRLRHVKFGAGSPLFVKAALAPTISVSALRSRVFQNVNRRCRYWQ